MDSFLDRILPYGGRELLFYAILAGLLFCYYHLFKGDVLKTIFSFLFTVGLISAILYIRTYENFLKVLFNPEP